jgi:hypothetical protein
MRIQSISNQTGFKLLMVILRRLKHRNSKTIINLKFKKIIINLKKKMSKIKMMMKKNKF